MKKKKIPLLGLVMIVKDEKHIITEALTSILPYIDTYVISDTGSTDGTQECIKTFFDSHHLSGYIFNDEWQDFGHNRSVVLRHAQSKMQFAWMLDADDLVVNNISKNDLRKRLDVFQDGFKISIINDNDSMSYHRIQIFNMKRKWKYEGVLHEYPDFDKPNLYNPKILELPIKVESRRLGARNKMDTIVKYQKDAEILLNAFYKNPKNERTVFYLAQSYRDCRNYEKAIEFYKIRTEMGKWPEEIYYSLYQIGLIYLINIKNEKLGREYCLKAFKFRSHRIESINILVQYYKSIQEYDLAHLYSSKIINVPYPKSDSLFIESKLYLDDAHKDHYILSFLCNKPCSTTDKKMDYIEFLKTIKSYFIKNNHIIPFPQNKIPTNLNPKCPIKYKYYRVMNPSIVHSDSKELWFNIRCVNFTKLYQSMDKNEIICTQNFITSFDLSKIYQLQDISKFGIKCRQNNAKILGYEDIRLFYHQKNWWFLANFDELSDYLNTPQMVLGRLASSPFSDDIWNIEYVVHLLYPFQKKTEKNWVPLCINENEFFIVYSSQPFILLQVDIVTGFCSIAYQLDWSPSYLKFPSQFSLRNSTPYIPFMDGFLTITHVVYFLQEYNNQRLYYHIFLFINSDFSNVRYSNIFKFENHNIEFANGIISHENNIIITYSLSDSIPKYCTFSHQEIESLLIFNE